MKKSLFIALASLAAVAFALTIGLMASGGVRTAHAQPAPTPTPTPSVAVAAVPPGTPVSDPNGDTFGVGGAVQLDISSIDAQVTSTALIITVEFYTLILPPSADALNSVFGFIWLDTDQNASSGVEPTAGLGAEIEVFLGDEADTPGQVGIYNLTISTFLGDAPISFTATSFVVTVPLTKLSGDDGLVNYFVLIGAPEPDPGSTYFLFTDEAPNEGVAASAAAPNPSPTPTPTPTPTATPTQAPSALPPTGGRPDSDGLPWLAVAAGVIAITTGGLALAYARRRVR